MCVWANILKLLMSQIISNLPGSLVCPHKKFSGYPCSLAQEGRTSASSMILQGSSTLLLPTYFFLSANRFGVGEWNICGNHWQIIRFEFARKFPVSLTS